MNENSGDNFIDIYSTSIDNDNLEINTSQSQANQLHYSYKVNPSPQVVASPLKKRSRPGEMEWKMFGKATSSMNANIDTNLNSLLIDHQRLGSQDNSLSSQFSQDFADRIGGLTVNCYSQPFGNGTQQQFNISQSADDFSIIYPNTLLSQEVTSMIDESVLEPGENSYHLSKPRDDKFHDNSLHGTTIKSSFPRKSLRASLKGNKGCKDIDDEDSLKMKIELDQPIDNIFYPFQSTNEFNMTSVLSQVHDNINNRNIGKGNQPRIIWITAYSERPRFITDFETEDILGEGTFSVVYHVKRRLDGIHYAIKKIKKPIESVKEELLVLQEVQAMAALTTSCPNIVHYFSSWISEDKFLHIQTELCPMGSLETWFVSNNGFKRQSLKLNQTTSFYQLGSDSIISYEQEQIPSFAKEEEDYNKRGISEELAWYILLIISETLKYMHHISKLYLVSSILNL